VTLTQLRRLGIGEGSVEHRVRIGRLHRVHRGVYAVGQTALDPRARDLAAVLAKGPSAVLSHRSAAALWGFMPAWRGDVDVLSDAARGGRRRAGIAVHRTRLLASSDRAVHDGVPVTTPVRTIVDLAAVLDRNQLARAVNEVQVLGLATLSALRERTAPHAPGKPGAAFLRELLAPDSGVTRSQLEDAFLSLLDSAGIARPEVNGRLGRFEVDFLWRRRRLVVEVDGFAYHGTAAAFERDRAKSAALAAGGFTVLRFTSRNLRNEPLRVAARVGAALGALVSGDDEDMHA